MSRVDELEPIIRRMIAGYPEFSPTRLIDVVCEKRQESLSAFDRAELEHRLQTNPPPSEEQLAAAEKARTEAACLAAEQEQARLAERITNAQTYRALRQQNPFAAARFAAENPGSYDPDSGPDAA